MERIVLKDIKTGRIVEVTAAAWNTLKAAGGRKQYDVVNNKATKAQPKTQAKKEAIPVVDTNEDGKRSANEMIAAIEKADSKKAVDVLIDGESRKTVLKAAQKRKSQL